MTKSGENQPSRTDTGPVIGNLPDDARDALAEGVRSPDVESDVACPSCGYNLRGLPQTGKCPECATPVLRALEGSAFETADRGWLRRLKLGGQLTFRCICIAGISLIAFCFSGLVTDRGASEIGLLLAVGCGVTAAGLLASAHWLVTSRNPAVSHESDLNRLRRRSRLFLLLSTLTICAIPLVYMCAGGEIVAIVAGILLFSYFLNLARFLEQLALFNNDGPYASIAHLSQWALSLLTCTFVVGLFLVSPSALDEFIAGVFVIISSILGAVVVGLLAISPAIVGETAKRALDYAKLRERQLLPKARAD